MSQSIRSAGTAATSRRGDYLLKTRWLLPVIGPPIENAWLRISRGRIHSFGRWPPRHRSEQFVDLEDGVVTAGFINAHTHLEFSGCPTPIDTSGGLPDWIKRVIDWRQLEPGDKRKLAIIRGLTESAEAGVVALGEIATAVPSGPDLPALQAGPRLRMFREVLGLAPTRLGALPAAATNAHRDLQRLLQAGFAVGLSPHAPYSTPWPLGRWALDEARSRHFQSNHKGGHYALLPLAMHLAESAEEEEFLKWHSGRFRQLFDSLGVWPATPPKLAATADWISLLARADRGLIVHGTHLPGNPLAWSRLQRHRRRLTVAICPRTTRALAGQLPPLADFLNAGIRVCLGTDGRGSTPDLSIRAEAACLIDAGLTNPAQALKMITINAAWGLGFERHTGFLAAGRPADLVLLRPAVAATNSTAATASVFAPDTHITATLRGGRLIAGTLN
jgi:cytosine/adenosine deaminase-related metal-dependent hydrolase